MTARFERCQNVEAFESWGYKVKHTTGDKTSGVAVRVVVVDSTGGLRETPTTATMEGLILFPIE